MVQLNSGRSDVINIISKKLINPNSRAHQHCLEAIGLLVGPACAKQRDVYAEKVFWPNITKLVEATYSELKEDGQLEVETPIVIVLNSFLKKLPTKHKQ